MNHSSAAASLAHLVSAMEAELNTALIPDYSNALNGLQLNHRKTKVTKVAAAVDASLAVIREAIAAEADLLLVHHGLFWQGLQRIDGPMFEKISLAVEAGLAIYSSHIPLDVHPALGNNAQLAKALSLSQATPFFPWKGIQLGLAAEGSWPLEYLVSLVTEAVGGSRVHVTAGGPQVARRVGIITGGAGSEVASVAATGVDTFITGEGQHWTAPLAEELGVNLIYAGHYATETFGVKALASWLQGSYSLPWVFIDKPTGL